MSQILITGVDPGTITAYALLDIKGNIISIKSKRNFPINSLILEISRLGKIFLVGTDVNPCPPATAKIAKTLNARILVPEESLTRVKKFHLVDSFLKTKKEFVKLNNKHERDALAAAVFSLKRTKTLLKKIDDRLAKQKNEQLVKKIKEKVLLENTPITKAVSSVC